METKSKMAEQETKKLILIVDDEEVIRNIIPRVIEMNFPGKYSISCVENGEEAVESYKKNYHSLIFTDNNMPKMNGLEAALEIKKEANEKKKDVKIILMTGKYLEVEGDFKAGKLPVDYLLKKPFKMDELDAVIKKYEGQK